MRISSYDRVASAYDFIKRLVFGKSLDKATSLYIDRIQSFDKVLIVGGGTGQLLETLPVVRELVYLDISEKMIAKARKRKSNNHTNFIQADFLTHTFDETFDAIICPFFLDNFSNEDLETAILKLKQSIGTKGKLIVTDFRVTNSIMWKLMLRIMHFFFRTTAGISSGSLKPIHDRLESAGFQEKECTFFRHKKIFSRIYVYLETL